MAEISSIQPIPDPTSYELWGATGTIFFCILLGLIIYVVLFGMSAFVNVKSVKDDWANQRCSPLIMPFASLFGHNTKENFEFCMGKVFTTHSMPYLSSIGTSFSQFTGLLQSMFDSVNGLRNTIASLGGGINVIFQEFTDRISNFFFKLRLSAVHLKNLFGRMYAIMFSVMYMGMSGITGMSSFTNTFLFSFLNVTCFPGDTLLLLEDTLTKKPKQVPIREIRIGDVLLPGHAVVTATFRFYSRGQPMVKLGNTIVSTNHYVLHHGKPIMAGNHPHAISLGIWDSDDLLYCLNTDTHLIPVEYLTFLDYAEVPECEEATMKWAERCINGKELVQQTYSDHCFAINEEARIQTIHGPVAAKDIQIGDRLTTGSEVAGIIRRQISDVCKLSDQVFVTPATLYWNAKENTWNRMGEHYAYHTQQTEMISFLVIPNSQIELENGVRVRDYMEVCSPDSKMYYSQYLESL